jgi:WD40 repeat protein
MRPFPGLRPFDFEDRDFFFGREDQIYSLYRLLEHSRFIAVVGSSGSGKSSLVRAGLLPVIEEESRGDGGRKWRFATFHPGDAPIKALAAAVTSLAQDSGEDAEIRHDRALFALRRSSFGLGKALDDVPNLTGKSVLLVVDQFEELFRYATSSTRDRSAGALWRDEAANFVQLLLEATRSRSSSVYVLITMRSDFIGDCSQFHGLPEAVSAAQFLVPSLTRDQREDVIRKPVDKAGATIDSTLVEVLLNEVSSEMDQLPVLQHCLSRLWDRAKPANDDKNSRHLGLAEYRAIGGISGALSQHADEVMASLPGLELAVEQVFRALSEIDKEGRATRRALPYSRLLAETGVRKSDLLRVLDRFRADDCSFILPSPSAVSTLLGNTRVDVVHEALLRRWERISAEQPHVLDGRMQTGWLAAEAADGRFYRAMLALLETESASNVATLPLDQVEARWHWWKSRPRTEAWAERYGGRLQSVEKLFQDSLAALAAERAREEETERREREQERRKIEAEEAAKRERLQHEAEVERMRAESAQRLTHRTRIAAFAMSVIALLAIVLAISSWHLRQVADENAALANNNAKIAQDESKKANAATKLAENKTKEAKSALALARNKVQEEAKDESATKAALNKANQQTQLAKQQRTIADQQRAIAQSQTKQTLAERSQVFLQAGRQALLDGDDNDAALLLAAAYVGESNNKVADNVTQLLLRQALDKLKIRPSSIPAHAHLITAMAFNPNVATNELATASTDGSAKLWSTSGKLLQQFNDQGDLITALAFDPRGRYLATVGRNGSAKLHELNNMVSSSDPVTVALRDVKDQLEGHAGRVNSVVFSHDGARILTSGSDGKVKLWSTSDGEMIAEWDGAAPGVEINDALFSPNDQIIAACAADGSLGIWDSSTATKISDGHLSSNSPLVRLAVSRQGNFAAGALDGTILYFDFAARKFHEWHDQHAPITALAFDSGGGRLLSASADGTAIILDATSGDPEHALPAKAGAPAVVAAAFNPSGNGIATTYSDGSVNVWTQQGEPVAVLQAAADAVVIADFSPDGSLLATGGSKGEVLLWPWPSELEQISFSHHGAVESIEFDNVGGQMLSASQDGTAALWRFESKPLIERVLPHTPGQAWVVAAHFSSDGSRIVTAGGDAAKIWSTNPKQTTPLLTIRTTAVRKRFTQASFLGRSHDVIIAQTDINSLVNPARTTDGWIVWSGDNARMLAKEPGWLVGIRQLDVTDDGKFVMVIGSSGYTFFCPTNASVDCVEWTGASAGISAHDHFIIGGASGNIHIVDPKGNQIGKFWPSNDQRVMVFAYSSDGKWLASGGIGGSLGTIWDLSHPASSHVPLAGGSGQIESASFSPGDATFLLATSSDGTAKLWDRASGNLLASVAVPGSRATSAAFTPDGSAVIIGAENGGMFVWPILENIPSPHAAAEATLRESDRSAVSDPLIQQAIDVLQKIAPDAY